MVKIQLINPPSPFLLDPKSFPPLGLLWVAAVYRKDGHDVGILDMADVPVDRIEEFITNKLEKADIYGVTATTPHLPYTLQINKSIKSLYPDATTVIGGPAATANPNDCLDFDKVIVGDGFTGAKLALVSNEKIIRAPMLKSLSGLPLPARDLVDMNGYRYWLWDGTRATNIMGAQGCVWNCSFCCFRTKTEYRMFRPRPPFEIRNEIWSVYTHYGIRGFMFYDDELNVTLDHLVRLCAVLEPLARGGFKFRGFIRSFPFLDDDVVEMLGKAGFIELCCGIESADDKILKHGIRKGTTVETNTRALRLCRKHGIRFKAFLSVGHPYENRESIQRLKDWILQEQPDDWDITIICPYPGSPLYDRPEAWADGYNITPIDFRRESSYYKSVPGEYHAYVSTPDLTMHELVRLRDEVDSDCRKTLGRRLPTRSV